MSFDNVQFAKIIIYLGLALIFLGLLFLVLGKIPFFGRLPGDIYIKKENFNFYFPLATCIILSIIFSIIMRIFRK